MRRRKRGVKCEEKEEEEEEEEEEEIKKERRKKNSHKTTGRGCNLSLKWYCSH